MSNNSTHSNESTRPLNLSGLVATVGQQQHKQGENLANLDDNPQEPGQPHKPLDLASLVNRVREVQKTDPESLKKPMEPTPTPVHAPDSNAPEHEHWYSSYLPHQLQHHHHDLSQSSTSAQALQEGAALVAPHPQEPSTAHHVASAFATTSRANNLETIDFTVESLAVTGAAAPAFLLQTDDKGRRPVSPITPISRVLFIVLYSVIYCCCGPLPYCPMWTMHLGFTIPCSAKQLSEKEPVWVGSEPKNGILLSAGLYSLNNNKKERQCTQPTKRESLATFSRNPRGVEGFALFIFLSVDIPLVHAIASGWPVICMN
ncbi:hypothetical protein EDD21DRAFT_118887 [Dissophora ornata]|nr:hypothetical protein EDD21DRAFT_118887 [Dissophora ornata]